MSKLPLEALAQMRASEVDEARLLLHEAHTRKAEAEQLVFEARRVYAEAGYPSSDEPLLSVQDYVWQERQAQARRLTLQRAEARCAKAEALHREALEAVRTAQARLIDAELERRAPATILARREAAMLRATELRREEEAEDAHRSRRSESSNSC